MMKDTFSFHNVSRIAGLENAEKTYRNINLPSLWSGLSEKLKTDAQCQYLFFFLVKFSRVLKFLSIEQFLLRSSAVIVKSWIISVNLL